ncbi:MAG: ADP-ribosylglycohydrolase family protein [Muribaculaceae bacterium]|nr:ADP-ribosylglycohydrolase family protein [Muribaculaceae bacterium]
MTIEQMQDKCRGSLVGGAIGDALGYEVEFMSLDSIRKRFGEKGITRYVLHDGVAQFSDDTQMTLFTLEGLMNGVIDTQAGKIEDILPYIEKAYLNWYRTQTSNPATLSGSWMSNIRSLWAHRAPGMTCMSALENLSNGFGVDNDSKGCGGVMRVAPIAIFNAAHRHIYDYAATAHLAGWSAEITHKHIASTFASALLATTVMNCILDETVDQLHFSFIVVNGLIMMSEYFPEYDRELRAFDRLIRRALELGQSDVAEADAIRELGEGWVGDEAIAIAIFSVMRHTDNFEDCIVCAVNHSGDSDSTGAIAGNLIGSILGYSAIPSYYLKDLEIEPILVSAADDLCADVKKSEVTRRIGERYVDHLPAAVDKKYLI